MWEPGLVDEVRRLEGEGLRDGVTAVARARLRAGARRRSTAGGTRGHARELTVVATRRFARRQRAWFRRDPRVHWLDPAGDPLAQALALV